MTRAVRCLTCGRLEMPTRSGNCRMARDEPPILLPQTRIAHEVAARANLELADELADEREFAVTAARVRAMAGQPTFSRLLQARGAAPEALAAQRELEAEIGGAA